MNEYPTPAHPASARRVGRRTTRQALIIIAPALLALLFAATTRASEASEEILSSPDSVIRFSAERLEQGDARSALDALRAGRERYPGDTSVLAAYADLLYRTERYGAARIAYRELQASGQDGAKRRIDEIDSRFDRLTTSLNLATVAIQKATDAGNYDTAIALGNLAIDKFPDNALLYTAKGEAQYRKGDLDPAEVSLRRALQIDPFNRQAQALIEEIRSTKEARTSTEFAEWLSIAKDKVGDFIVTFLALFAAFLVNSLVAPITLRLKLNRARRLFEQGQYDEFTDLIEGMLDKEDFSPLRANFRFLLREKTLEEAREILDKYVNTPDRLPALIRILEREHEKMAQSA